MVLCNKIIEEFIILLHELELLWIFQNIGKILHKMQNKLIKPISSRQTERGKQLPLNEVDDI